MHSSRADSRTGSQLPRSSAATFLQLPSGARVVSHPEPTTALESETVRSCGAHLVVVRRDDELPGWPATVLNRDHTQSHWGWLKRMHVLPEAQGAGIGSAMLDTAVDICRSVGLSQLHLTTDGQSGPVDFYGNKGFVEVGRMPRNTLAADGSLHDEVYMVREFENAQA
ncbi:GNAT family N-acetyltransferase [Streptomyces sp. MBT53]|uniref:GNAT family N-acetyltransferase n=1 Tax=Streptomyces sp. MBT53 TaxID=1488384 RepID=UPI001913D2CB|nr:GNAT family N-acetyltransferase [Streptomyces sp. MBT53]MBK6016076.1 GNAT family N-acetyltransferase [Streptomyces sp. MBT53]